MLTLVVAATLAASAPAQIRGTFTEFYKTTGKSHVSTTTDTITEAVWEETRGACPPWMKKPRLFMPLKAILSYESTYKSDDSSIHEVVVIPYDRPPGEFAAKVKTVSLGRVCVDAQLKKVYVEETR